MPETKKRINDFQSNGECELGGSEYLYIENLTVGRYRTSLKTREMRNYRHKLTATEPCEYCIVVKLRYCLEGEVSRDLSNVYSICSTKSGSFFRLHEAAEIFEDCVKDRLANRGPKN